MRSPFPSGVGGHFLMLKLMVLMYLVPLVTPTAGNASSSKEFFSLLAQPGIGTIILNNDISLELQDAPSLPVNLTANLTIVAGLPEPRVAGLAANYIASKIRLAPDVTLTFERIILSGILRGTGQHLDLLTRSDGGAVIYNKSINHRRACLPFDLFYKQLSSLPEPLKEAGLPLNISREFWLRNDTYCWLNATAHENCMTPYLDMSSYGTYNQKIDGVLGNGGYNSFFVRSYGVCDKEISEECISQKNADLCLAAALAVDDEKTEQAKGTSTQLAIGLGVGLGGALLLAVALIAAFARVHWRHAMEASRAVITNLSSRPKAAFNVSSEGMLPTHLTDMDKGGEEVGILTSGRKLNGIRPGTADGDSRGAAVVGVGTGGLSELRLAVNGDGEEAGAGSHGGRGKGGLTSTATGGCTGGTGSITNGSSSSSGVTIEASSVTCGGQKNGGGNEGPGSAGMGEVEVARLNLLVNAAKGRAGRSAPLDVKVLQLLGQGSFGKVYKGMWHGTLVALKAQVLPPSLSGDARRRHMAVMEAAISSAINHPAIVQTYCYSFRPIKDTVGRTVVKHGRKSLPIREEPEDYYAAEEVAVGAGDGGDSDAVDGGEDYGHELLLVLEYCDGGSLRAALDKGLFHQGRPWPWDWRRAIQAAGHAATAGQAGRLQPLHQHQPQNQPSPMVTAGAGPGPAFAATMAAMAPMPPPQSDSLAIANLVAAITRGSHSVPPSNTPDGENKCSGPNTAAISGPPPPPLPPQLPGNGTAGRNSGAGGPSGLVGSGGSAIADGDSAGRRSLTPNRTVGASEVGSSVFPKLDTYEPDFTHGAFEVILPAGEDVQDSDAANNVDTAVTTAVKRAPQPEPSGVAATLNIFNMLAGAPTAATSFVSSFNNVFGAGASASAADNAAAAAAADRLAMMFLLQQAAAAIAAGAEPAVGGYAKMLADYISGSNLTGLNTRDLGDLLGTGVTAAAAPAGTVGVVSHSSDDTLVAPPPAILTAVSGTPPLAPPAAAAVRSVAASGSSPLRSQASLQRITSSGAALSEASGTQQQPQPAIRYGLMLAVAADVASGLLHLHAHGVVHGDVKASNVLLKQIVVSDPLDAAGRAMDTMSYGGGGGTGPSSSAQPMCPSTAAAVAAGELLRASSVDSADRAPRLGLCAKVSDFGLSTMLSASNTDTHISATTAAGSLSHMSPELLLCGHVSKANDVYAYGVLLFELFTGERAWEGMPRALLPARVALEGWRPVFPPHTPAAYRQLAERCWLADPSKRPTFHEVMAALKDMRDAVAVEMLPEWVPVPNPQLSFLQQLVMQRRPTGSLAASPGAPASQHQPHLTVGAAPVS